MDLSTIKSEINKALSQSHAKGLTYDDLFIKTFDPYDPTYKSRVHNSSLQEFEAEIQELTPKDEDFVIYIQHDDANFFGADCDNMVLNYINSETDPDTFWWFEYGNITIYIVID